MVCQTCSSVPINPKFALFEQYLNPFTMKVLIFAVSCSAVLNLILQIETLRKLKGTVPSFLPSALCRRVEIDYYFDAFFALITSVSNKIEGKHYDRIKYYIPTPMDICLHTVTK